MNEWMNAGSRRSVVFVFVKPKQINSSVWSQTVSWIISNNFCFILFPCLLINIIFLVLQKTGAKTAPRAPQLSARVNGTPAAGVIGHLQLLPSAKNNVECFALPQIYLLCALSASKKPSNKIFAPWRNQCNKCIMSKCQGRRLTKFAFWAATPPPLTL